jgi:hypothetical protein
MYTFCIPGCTSLYPLSFNTKYVGLHPLHTKKGRECIEYLNWPFSLRDRGHCRQPISICLYEYKLIVEGGASVDYTCKATRVINNSPHVHQ